MSQVVVKYLRTLWEVKGGEFLVKALELHQSKLYLMNCDLKIYLVLNDRCKSFQNFRLQNLIEKDKEKQWVISLNAIVSRLYLHCKNALLAEL